MIHTMSTSGGDTTGDPNVEPSSKKPKSMASVGLGQKLFMNPLPSYSGPYSVGYMEIEVPVRNPRSFSHIRRNHKPLLNLETVLFSLYYPCRSDLREARYFEAHMKSSQPSWFPHPRFKVGKSYARLAGFRKWPTIAFLAATTMSTKLPAQRNAR
jgi:platelet-activating factor acetylhydrolase